MECCDSSPDGGFSARSLERYRNLFEGDAGIIVFESITMQYDSRARADQISLQPDNPENVASWKKFIKEMKAINPDPLLIVQLNHSGEVSSSKFSKRVCVKPLHGFGGEMVDEKYVEDTIDLFVRSSKVLHDCGADGVDLKFCHGYFGSQILRPYNDRKWKYGGPWENRSRFAFEMIEKVRKVVNHPNFIVGSKVSMWEGFPGGTGDGGSRHRHHRPEGIHRAVQGPGAARGQFHSGIHGKPFRDHGSAHAGQGQARRLLPALHDGKDDQGERGSATWSSLRGAYSVLNTGKNHLLAVQPEWNSLIHWGKYNIEHGYADMVALGRQSLADPKLPAKWLADKEDEIKWCIACDACVELLIRQENVGCTVHNKPYVALLRKVRAEKGPLKWKVTGED